MPGNVTMNIYDGHMEKQIKQGTAEENMEKMRMLKKELRLELGFAGIGTLVLGTGFAILEKAVTAAPKVPAGVETRMLEGAGLFLAGATLLLLATQPIADKLEEYAALKRIKKE